MDEKQKNKISQDIRDSLGYLGCDFWLNFKIIYAVYKTIPFISKKARNRSKRVSYEFAKFLNQNFVQKVSISDVKDFIRSCEREYTCSRISGVIVPTLLVYGRSLEELGFKNILSGFNAEDLYNPDARYENVGADIHESEKTGDLYYIANLMLDTKIDVAIKKQMIVNVLAEAEISKRDREWAAKKYFDLKKDV